MDRLRAFPWVRFRFQSGVQGRGPLGLQYVDSVSFAQIAVIRRQAASGSLKSRSARAASRSPSPPPVHGPTNGGSFRRASPAPAARRPDTRRPDAPLAPSPRGPPETKSQSQKPSAHPGQGSRTAGAQTPRPRSPHSPLKARTREKCGSAETADGHSFRALSWSCVKWRPERQRASARSMRSTSGLGAMHKCRPPGPPASSSPIRGQSRRCACL